MLLHAHSGVRYLVLLAGFAALLYALLGVVTGRPYDRRMSVLASAFAGSMHLQILVGFALLLSGTFYPQLIGHLITMVLAAAVAQLVPSIMRRRPMEARSYLPHLVGTAVALGLVWAGVASIGRGLFTSTAG